MHLWMLGTQGELTHFAAALSQILLVHSSRCENAKKNLRNQAHILPATFESEKYNVPSAPILNQTQF